MDEAGVQLRLSSTHPLEVDHLRAWVRALGRVDGRRLLALTAADEAARLAVEELCARADISLADSDDFPVDSRDVVIFALGDVIPAPWALTRLAEAVRQGAAAAVPRWLPFTAGDDEPIVCVAVSGGVAGVDGAHAVEEAVGSVVRAGSEPVRVESAAVFHDRRFGDDEAPGDNSTAQAPYGHPATVSSTPLHRILRQVGIDPPRAPGALPDRPLLTVITRTQGIRPECLDEVLTCLSAQSIRDFELLLACHRVDEADMSTVRAAVAATPPWLQARTRLLEVARPGRSAPLNDALEVARGRYTAVLDDDDTVTAHWVETFAGLEARDPGTVLRAAAARQDVERLTVDVNGVPTVVPRELGHAYPAWPRKFDLAEHLWDNASPCMTLAFPRGIFEDLGQRFDETLRTAEDWDYLLRAVAVVGVTSTPTITSVYRIWTDHGGSRHVHDESVWAEDRKRILARIDELILLLAPGQATAIRNLYGRLLDERAEKHQIAAMHERVIAERDAVTEAYEEVRDAHDRAVAGRDAALARVDESREKITQLRERLRVRRLKIDDLAARVADLESQLPPNR